MSFFEKIKELFSGQISDEEIANEEWVLCPKCLVYINKRNLIDNNFKCPNCSCSIIINEEE